MRRVAICAAVVLGVLLGGCGGGSDDAPSTGAAAEPRAAIAQKDRMREIQAQSVRLAREGERAKHNAEQAALYGERRRQRNAERLMTLDYRKLKALTREAEAILAEARREHAP
ncbi:MAG TPA: hypothetical protein VJU14_10930 [Solirubrobacterales bacterium]|nr:hypothetical protein [Solirubrobacterales bacterium]